jgi:phosphohistidine phosphatase
MKRLYILRHAKAATPDNVQDFDRPLAPQGLEDAAALGKLMMKQSYTPDAVLCSTAKRTRETLEALGLPASTKVEYPEKIYDASAGDLLEMIQNTDDSAESILLIGHNPAIHELALRLSSEDSGLSLLQRLLQGYSPATLSILDVPCKCWNDIQLGENFLINLLAPIDYNSPDRPTRWM